VQNFVHLLGQFLVNSGDHLLDRVENFALYEARIGERLGDQRLHRVFDFARRAFAARLEILLQQCGEFVGFGKRRSGFRLRLLFGSHGESPSLTRL